jgi:hypothetical protein
MTSGFTTNVHSIEDQCNGVLRLIDGERLGGDDPAATEPRQFGGASRGVVDVARSEVEQDHDAQSRRRGSVGVVPLTDAAAQRVGHDDILIAT